MIVFWSLILRFLVKLTGRVFVQDAEITTKRVTAFRGKRAPTITGLTLLWSKAPGCLLLFLIKVVWLLVRRTEAWFLRFRNPPSIRTSLIHFHFDLRRFHRRISCRQMSPCLHLLSTLRPSQFTPDNFPAVETLTCRSQALLTCVGRTSLEHLETPLQNPRMSPTAPGCRGTFRPIHLRGTQPSQCP